MEDEREREAAIEGDRNEPPAVPQPQPTEPEPSAEEEPDSETETETEEDTPAGTGEALVGEDERANLRLGIVMAAERLGVDSPKALIETVLGPPPDGFTWCSHCRGFAIAPDGLPLSPEHDTCDVCLGNGEVRTGSHVVSHVTTQCPKCRGVGYLTVLPVQPPPESPQPGEPPPAAPEPMREGGPLPHELV